MFDLELKNDLSGVPVPLPGRVILFVDAGGALRARLSDGTVAALEAGPQGAQGVPGEPGAPGAPGSQGVPGVQGVPGDPGSQGDPGADGAQGPQGVPGADGAQGPQGVPGADGAQGPQGVPGAHGAQGPQGVPGAVGAQGPQGVQGVPGMVNLSAAITTANPIKATRSKVLDFDLTDLYPSCNELEFFVFGWINKGAYDSTLTCWGMVGLGSLLAAQVSLGAGSMVDRFWSITGRVVFDNYRACLFTDLFVGDLAAAAANSKAGRHTHLTLSGRAFHIDVDMSGATDADGVYVLGGYVRKVA